MAFSADDHRFMARALRLAEHGLFTTSPNPRVGCVLVKNNAIIGEGWHERAGEPHAEIAALRDAATKVGAGGTADCTAYVTLEPCSHHGRTPPCADALIAARVGRVVAAMTDPNPLVAGQGLDRLRTAGMDVGHGLLENEARELNIGFVSRMTRARPWVRLKVAASIDGKTALANGQSQWITGPDARRDVHAWRARTCAMLTGIGTVRDDDPRLTVRDVATSRQPLRVVVDSRLDISPDAAILEGGRCLIACAQEHPDKAQALSARGAEIIVLPNAAGKVDLPALCTELGRRGINEVMVEAGLKLNGSLLREGCVDELLIYQAPLLLGDAARGMADFGELTALAGATRLTIVERRSVGADFFIRARFG
ncbi:MAG: bifunctional diaminohydroxyphosphoribosylaminopyrimidine deaminase/5-amino-6-(5-phosphoribosylamino)uracil reductase RibD [Rhodocyclaceae bacterium]|jgi:diaminohydroxyphosphoribosylaminopyrimidine deaminase/5-amino-6-(5-phosphoribosylamino)uracil reductase|nr:bifunctional diaminohydroxyphosphoribosylaminopyrimidine deaminase/5-amino-6-(5-phosphoribosylamino)uracil reductase RibD [Rhodocyclaceae bacterium]